MPPISLAALSYGRPMTPLEFKSTRHALGLTLAQMAERLGVSPRQVRRYEAPIDCTSHRAIPIHTVKLLEALQQGYLGTN